MHSTLFLNIIIESISNFTLYIFNDLFHISIFDFISLFVLFFDLCLYYYLYSHEQFSSLFPSLIFYQFLFSLYSYFFFDPFYFPSKNIMLNPFHYYLCKIRSYRYRNVFLISRNSCIETMYESNIIYTFVWNGIFIWIIFGDIFWLFYFIW